MPSGHASTVIHIHFLHILILSFSIGAMNQGQVEEVAVDFFVVITLDVVKEER